jgi:hypothetical protein
MNNERVGMVAGMIWQVFSNNNNNALTLTALKKALDAENEVSKEETCAAIGWLLREDKVESNDNKFCIKM